MVVDRLAHVVPDGAAPYCGMVTNNFGSRRMGYQPERETKYVAAGCDGDNRMWTITVRLKNAASAGAQLPECLGGTEDFSHYLSFQVPTGTMATSVRLIGTLNAGLNGALAVREHVPVSQGTERHNPSFEVHVLIPPGQSGELASRHSEPTSLCAPSVPAQSLVDIVTLKRMFSVHGKGGAWL